MHDLLHVFKNAINFTCWPAHGGRIGKHGLCVGMKSRTCSVHTTEELWELLIQKNVFLFTVTTCFVLPRHVIPEIVNCCVIKGFNK